MANNKTTYTLQIDAEINSLEKKLGTIQNLMQNVMNSADAPKGLEKSFEKIGSLIDKIRTKASAPIDSKSGFTSIGKDIEAVNIALGSLYKMIGSVGEMSEASRISFLPPEAQKEIATIIKSIEAYQAAIASATTETAELIEARKELAKAETTKSKADADLELKQQSLDRAKQEQKNAQAAIDAINERKAALDDLLKKQEEIEKFYSTEGADGKKPNRSKKYDGVSMRPQDIKRQIKNQEALMVGDADELEKQSKALKQAKIDIESYERQVGTAQRRWNDTNDTFNAATKAVETLNATFESNSNEKKQAAYSALKAEASKLGIAVSDLNDEFSETDANILTQRLVELKQKGLAPVVDAMDKAQAETREMSSVIKKTNEEVKEGTEVWKENSEAASQQDAFENKIKSFLGVAGAAQVMRHALRDAMQTITELDKTMTEMSVVTDLEVSDYWDQLPQYTKRANELGLAINDVYKADTLYYQQGLKTNEVITISTETMKMARIAGLDTAEATDRMTAALRGFNMELNETSAGKIADVYSELAAITAADVDEISTAMTKTASIASSAGMEFETTAAFLSQIIETTRESAETAGTAMKTVIARFQELKKAPDEIGEVDGEIVDANAIETALRSVGVELRDAGGQFRELDDVFLELSSKWDSLDKNTQRYIATIAAGSRQQSRFIAMMSDYGRTQELVTAANNSAGASNRQFEKTMDSLASKIEKLKNTWHEFTMGIMNSDLVKIGVDILTKFLEVVNNATSGLDGIAGSFVKIASVLVIFKTGMKIFEKFKAPIMNLFNWVVQQAGLQGMEAGKAFREGAEKGTSKEQPIDKKEELPAGYKRDGKGRLPDPTGKFVSKDEEEWLKYAPEEKKRVGTWLGEKTGITDIKQGYASLGKNSDYGQERAKLKEMEKSGGNMKERQQKLKIAEDNKKFQISEFGENDESIKVYDDEIKKAKQNIIELKKQQDATLEAGNKGWNQLSEGLTKMGETAISAGVGISMLGGLLSSLGLEEVGEGVSQFGNIVTMAGTAIVTVIPIIKTLSSTLVAGGLSAQAAWWWAILIVAAVAALVVGIIAIAKTVENASPEGKLKKAQEAADNAAEAADNAADSYSDLKSSIEGLDEQYKALEKLTQGTKEWNDAILEINNSVLDLIEKYPELAKYVTQQDGYLSIDTSSSEVLNVIKASQGKALMTKNISALATAEVSRAEAEVIKSSRKLTGTGIEELSKAVSRGEILIGENGFEKGAKTFEELGYTEEQLQSIYNTNKGNIGGLIDYGDMLLNAEAQKQTSYSSMAISAQQMANTSTFSNEEKQIMSNLIDGGEVSQAYEKELKKISSINYTDDKNLSEPQKIQRDRAIREVYGDDVKLEDLTNEQIQAAIAQTKSMPKTIAQIEKIPAMMDRLTENNSESVTKMLTHMFTDWDGGNMTLSDFNELTKLSEEQLKKIYKDLGASAKEIFGTEEEFLSQVKKTEGILVKQNKAMQTSVEMMFGKDAKLPSWNIPPEIGSQLLLKFQDVFNNADPEAFQGFYDAFNDILTNLTAEQQTIFAGILESVDWEDTTELATLPDKLSEAGLEFESLGVNIYDFIDITKTATHAIAKLTSEELATVLNDVYTISKNINKGEQGRVFSEQQYNSLLAADPTLRKEFAKTADGYMYLGNSMQDLRTAVLENTSALKGEDPETAQKTLNALDGFEDLVTTFNNTIDTSKEEKAEYDEALGKYNAAAAEKEVASRDLAEAQRTMSTVTSSPFLYAADASFTVNSDHPELAGLGEAIQFVVGLFNEGAAELYDMAYGTMFEGASDTIDKSKAIIADATERMTENKSIISDYANAQNKEYAAYNKITAGNTEMPIEQLVAFFTQLDKNIQAKGGRLEDYGIEGLKSNLDFSILAKSKPDELKNWFAQVYSLLADKTNLENMAAKTPEEDLGNNIMSVVVDGVQGLRDYFSDYINNKGTNDVLKGAMIKMASDYGISEKILQQFFDADGKVITEKFNEFIELLNEKEEEERFAVPKEQTIDLLNQVKDALVDARQKEIDELASRFDAIVEANEKVVNAIQEQIAEDRQRRENDKKEESISDKYSQLAYLSMDTSGNLLDQLKLQEEISQEEQDYQDSLIDQSIQKLQDANQKAQEQRDRQITLLQAQLDIWQNSTEIWDEVNAIIASSSSDMENGVAFENTELGKLLNSYSGNLSPEEKDNFVKEIIGLIEGYDTYHNQDSGNVTDNGDNKITEIIKNPTPSNNRVEYPTRPVSIIVGTSNNSLISNKPNPNIIQVHYADGGLADFTGPAWLDGTKSRPEYILNADQTKRFFSLIDVLERFDDKDSSGSKTGDNYFDIEINVEKLENDYDVEQIANKIRRMIYDDATYRNVNAVSMQ